jgi:hypothetical protein
MLAGDAHQYEVLRVDGGRFLTLTVAEFSA